MDRRPVLGDPLGELIDPLGCGAIVSDDVLSRDKDRFGGLVLGDVGGRGSDSSQNFGSGGAHFRVFHHSRKV